MLNRTNPNGVDIGLSSVWGTVQGSAQTVVAVIDTGIDLEHPDLNIHPYSYDAHTGTSPSRIRGAHGTACAGIIGAHSNNSIGIAGVAPKSPIMSISIALGRVSSSDAQIADAINMAWRNGASVISNSWGGGVESDLIVDALRNAIKYGRNGKGAVVVFAAGNSNQPRVSFPANSLPEIIAVGAVSSCGERKSPRSCDNDSSWGSNYGEALDIVAPGAKIYTTDNRTFPNYNSSNTGYYSDFGGTSAACPHVAGVAALLLSIKPELTQSEVHSIITRSASKLSKYSFTENKSYGSWNREVGYGMLNASQAIMFATRPNIVYYHDKFSSNPVWVTGFQIETKNVGVHGGSLTLEMEDMTTIFPPFNVNTRASFVIKRTSLI